MSESQEIRIYEVQSVNRGIWESDRVHPWTNVNMEESKSWDEFMLPSNDWSWVGNWKIEKEAGRTDKDGWEYASKYERHLEKGRKPKPEKKWNDKSRRRLWVRTMRREALAGGRTTSVSGNGGQDIMERVKSGLATIHNARLKIEQTMKTDPDSVSASKRNDLIMSVRKNVEDISNMLQQAELKQSTNKVNNRATITMLNKLRRDCEKEKDAIEAALQQNQASQASQVRDRSATVNTMATDEEPQFTRLNMSNKSNSFANPKANTPPITVFNANPGLNNKNIRPGGGNGAAPVVGGVAKTAVQGGKGAISFSMDKIVAANIEGTPDDIKDGVYMSQSLQTQLIEKKLVGKDEATVMQELIDERNLAIDEVYVGLVEVNKMFTELSELVKANQPEIEEICKNIDDSHAYTEKGYNDILEANRLQIEGGACIIS